MDRGISALPHSLLVVPVAALLVASGLTTPARPYLGLTLRGELVAAVEPGAPAWRAGIRAGDHLHVPPSAGDPLAGAVDPTAAARAGTPLDLVRDRDGIHTPVRVHPDPLPPPERGMRVLLFAVACGFVLLGGWVWSERRDRLTSSFVLLCMLFAALLTPPPRLAWSWAALAYEIAYGAATLWLPAAAVRFFARFPEPSQTRHGEPRGIGASSVVASVLVLASLVAMGLRIAGLPAARTAYLALEIAASAWFVGGLAWATVLFARSYGRVRTLDARRRLRVAVAGTALGLLPLLAVVLLRTIDPGRAVPGERVAVVATLLVPAAFAWAIAVHRIFEFRLALRALGAVAIVVALGTLAFLVAAGAASRFGAPIGDASGVALAVVGLVASAAGPLRAPVRRFAESVAASEAPPLVASLAREGLGRGGSAEAALTAACAAVRSTLRLDRCLAMARSGSGWGAGAVAAFATAGSDGSHVPAPEMGPGFAATLARAGGLLSVEDDRLGEPDRDALEGAGIQWMLPVGDGDPIAVLLLGRRLAGPWLDQAEIGELQRLAAQLALALENAALRTAAANHGAIDRELEQAGAMQTHLLPRRLPVHATLDCAAATLSAEPVGGDCYDVVEGNARGFTLVVGDARGHGVPAALLLAGVQARFRSVAARGEPPGAVLAALNHELAHRQSPDLFVGLLCARVDVRAARLELANGGLTPPVVCRAGGRIEVLTEGGLPLGVRDGARYPEIEIELEAGDVAVLHTDGLTEARRGDEMFGVDRVARVVAAQAHRRARDILDALLAEVRAFAEVPLDDLTVLVLKQLADPRRGPRPAHGARPELRAGPALAGALSGVPGSGARLALKSFRRRADDAG